MRKLLIFGVYSFLFHRLTLQYMLNLKVFEQFPHLTTKRLRLRDIRLQDAAAIFSMRSNGRVNQFIPRPEMSAPEQAEQLVVKTREAFLNHAGIGWAAMLRDKEECIGTCGYNSIDLLNHRAEIGGEMATEYWGKQIAQEAVKEILRFGMEEIGFHTIEAKVSPLNRGAVFILESLGFVKEAHFKDRIYFQGKYSDMAVYTLHKFIGKTV